MSNIAGPRLRLMAAREVIAAMRACGDDTGRWPRACAIAGLKTAGAEALNRARRHKRNAWGWAWLIIALGVGVMVGATYGADGVVTVGGAALLVFVGIGGFEITAWVVLSQLGRVLSEDDPRGDNE